MQKTKDPLTKPIKVICWVVPKGDEHCVQGWLWGLLPWSDLSLCSTKMFSPSPWSVNQTLSYAGYIPC